jgi:periplasmic divalent cation tolerance protein
MNEPENVVVFVTAPEAEAQGLAEVLVREKKAACVNVVPRVRSTYWWQGEIESDDESLLIIKTRLSLLDGLIEAVKETHSYEVPEVIALPILGGNQDYLDWIGGALR